MASATLVSPTTSQVNDIYGRLLSVLNIGEGRPDLIEVDNTRELRFVLRKFVYSLFELAGSGSRDKEAYIKAACDVGENESGLPDTEAIGLRASATLCSILEDAAWGFVEGKSDVEQPINVSLKAIKDGCRETIAALSASLKEDGSEDREWGEETASASAPETPRRRRQPASGITTPSRPRTPGSGQGNYSHAPGMPWTDEEDLEALRVVRDLPVGTGSSNLETRAAEHNRRMNAIRAGRGEQLPPPRTGHGFRQQLRKLGIRGTTIASLEATLGITNGGDSQG